MYKIGKMPQAVDIGYVGETGFRKLEIDMKDWMRLMPEGVPSIVCIRPGETKADAYVAVTTFEDDVLTWVITAADIGTQEGEGEIQIWLEEEENSSVIKRGKSVKVKTRVNDAVNDPSPDTPTSQEAFIEQVTELKTAAVNAKTAAETAQGKAEDAQEAAEAAQEAAEAAVVHQPYIDSTSKHWMVWDNETEAYVDTEILAEGHTPVRGTDYWTQQDQTAVVAAAAQATAGEIIDDTAGEGTTGKTWSANKLDTEITDVKTAIQGLEENCVEYILQKKIIVGENQIDSTAQASGTGWSGSVANGFTHSSGNTDPLVIAVDTVANAVYIVEFDLTNQAEGAIKAGIGDSPVADTYNGSGHVFVGFIADGGYLKLYPKTTYTGTITNIKLRQEVETGTELTHECKNIVNDKDITDISGFWNTAIGPNALKNNQNGTRNIAEGYCALWKLISGNRNIAIGTYAMPFITEGENNIAIGSDSLYNPARSELGGRSEGCIAIGKAALRSGENTVDNVAIGGAAMSESDLNAEQTTAIGVRAGFSAGNHGVFIGYRAGYQLTVEGNTCIGHEAGFKQYNNGKNNIFIGAGAKPNVAGASASTPKTCSNSIVIGQGAECDGSWQIVIGKPSHTLVKIAGKIIHFNEDGTVTWS